MPSILAAVGTIQAHKCQDAGQIMWQEPISGTLMQESRFSIPDTFFFPPP